MGSTACRAQVERTKAIATHTLIAPMRALRARFDSFLFFISFACSRQTCTPYALIVSLLLSSLIRPFAIFSFVSVEFKLRFEFRNVFKFRAKRRAA